MYSLKELEEILKTKNKELKKLNDWYYSNQKEIENWRERLIKNLVDKRELQIAISNLKEKN